MVGLAACYTLYQTTGTANLHEQRSPAFNGDYSVLSLEHGLVAIGMIAASLIGGLSEHLYTQASAAYTHWTAPEEGRKAAELLAKSTRIDRCTLKVEESRGAGRKKPLREIDVDIYDAQLPGMPLNGTVLVFSKDQVQYRGGSLYAGPEDPRLLHTGTQLSNGDSIRLPDGRCATWNWSESITSSMRDRLGNYTVIRIETAPQTRVRTLVHDDEEERIPEIFQHATRVTVDIEQREITYYRQPEGNCIAEISIPFSGKGLNGRLLQSLSTAFTREGIELRSYDFRHNYKANLFFIDLQSEAHLSPQELAKRLRTCEDRAITFDLPRITGRDTLDQLVEDLELVSQPELRTSCTPTANVKRARH
jgi:hypothetical protein